MISLSKIQAPIAPFLERFDQAYQRQLTSDSPLVAEALSRLGKHPGKRIRPTLMGLSAGLFTQPIPETTVSAAVMIELLHTSSLVHDDVIDEADMRRNQPTLNSVYGNHAAVLVGDFILAGAFAHSLEAGFQRLSTTVAQVGKQLAEGELLQMAAAKRAILPTRETYLQIIEKKTASMFQAAMMLGGETAGAPTEQVLRLGEIGLAIGYAFQIRDDILDYTGSSNQVGKPTANDLLEGKVTLPLIAAYEPLPQKQKEQIGRLRQEAVDNPEALAQLIAFAHDHGGVSAAQKTLDDFLANASQHIDLLPSHPAQVSLRELVEFLALRSY